jgi:DNA-binding XRE family transcriptional regulator
MNLTNHLFNFTISGIFREFTGSYRTIKKLQVTIRQNMASENNLKNVRQSAGVTVAQLNRASGVSDKTIRKIENRIIKGKVETKVNIIKGLTGLTGVDYQYKDIFPYG